MAFGPERKCEMGLCEKCEPYYSALSGLIMIPAKKIFHCHHEEKKEGCGICGSQLIKIRGRHPREPWRKVCATCLQERFERIHEETSSDYNKGYKGDPNEKEIYKCFTESAEFVNY